jgi:nucleoside-diphosphate-sugar epimerase
LGLSYWPQNYPTDLPPLGIGRNYPRRLDFFISSRAFEISKARRLLGYQPQVDLHTGLAQTAAWYRQEKYL